MTGSKIELINLILTNSASVHKTQSFTPLPRGAVLLRTKSKCNQPRTIRLVLSNYISTPGGTKLGEGVTLVQLFLTQYRLCMEKMVYCWFTHPGSLLEYNCIVILLVALIVILQ